MNTASLPSSSAANDICGHAQSLQLQLDALRRLLLDAAKAISTSDAQHVQSVCEALTAYAVNLRPSWGELFSTRDLRSIQSEQEHRILLRSLLEARAFYVASMRRWRRSLRLRRSLLEMRTDLPAYDGDELFRGY